MDYFFLIQVQKSLYSKVYFNKTYNAVTSIKQAPVFKGHLFVLVIENFI